MATRPAPVSATVSASALAPPRPAVEVEDRYRRRRGELAIWWREIDRTLLMLVIAMMLLGAAAVAAASPASARRLSTSAVKLGDLHFFLLHVRWQLVGLAVLFGASLLTKDMARRVGIVLAAVMLVLLMLVPVFGSEVNGARRWLNLGLSLQPSSFLKTGFPIVLAWIFSWRVRDQNLPVMQISIALLVLICALLMLQPDFGSALLFVGIWFTLALLSGLSVKRIALFGVIGVTLVGLAYQFYGNARHRIDSFLGGGTAFDQVALAERTLLNGGWTGTGFWLGTRKMSLPEAHTDYIFSVIGEEFGLLACAVIVILVLAIVARVLLRLIDEEDLFTVLAASGLVAEFGGQAFINIMVNLQLFPSKGMTLPLISYGGSSTLAICASMGLLLAITRRNPFIKRERLSLSDIGDMR